MASNLIPTRVLWWDDEMIFGQYKCPSCHEDFERDFPFRLGSSGTYPRTHTEDLVLPGTSNATYQFEFPFSEECESSWFKIEKRTKRYMALDVDSVVPQPRPGDVDLPALMRTLAINQKSQRCSNSSEATNSHKRTGCCDLKRLLDASDEVANVLVRGSTESGLCVLGSAASMDHPSTVQLLLRSGADSNRRCHNGDTPLILAVRGGSYSSTYLLLRHGADKFLKNNAGESAVSIAQKMVNDKSASKARKILTHLLSEQDAAIEIKQPRLSRKSEGPSYSYQRSPQGELQLWKQSPVATFDDKNSKNKSFGVLILPGGDPRVAAVSGFKHNNLKASILGLAEGDHWTKEAMRIATSIQHDIAGGANQQSFASHVEPQLMACFISENVFLAHDLDNEELRRLAEIEPPIMLRKASIQVYNPVMNKICDSCVDFGNALNQALGLEIELLAVASSGELRESSKAKDPAQSSSAAEDKAAATSQSALRSPTHTKVQGTSRGSNMSPLNQAARTANEPGHADPSTQRHREETGLSSSPSRPDAGLTQRSNAQETAAETEKIPLCRDPSSRRRVGTGRVQLLFADSE